MLIINLPSDGLSKKDIFTAMVKAAGQASFEAQLMADNEEAIVEALMNREKWEIPVWHLVLLWLMPELRHYNGYS